MEGPSGLFYKQFAYTLATAILISALNALTLSPALCALLLRNNHHDDKEKELKGSKLSKYSRRFFDGFNVAFDTLTNKYIRSLNFLLRKKWLTLALLALLSAAGIFLMNRTPSSFIPTEDDSFVTFSMSMPPGASLARTTEVLQRADSIVRKREQISGMTTISGYNAIDATASPAFAVGYINLKDHKERGEIKDINAFMDSIRQDLSQISEATFSVYPRPTVQGFGDFSGLEFVLQDRLGGTFASFSKVANNFIQELQKRPEIETAFTPFKANFPQYQLEVDFVKAQALGVTAKDLMTTIRGYYGRVQAGDFSRFGRQYRIYMQADARFTNDPESF